MESDFNLRDFTVSVVKNLSVDVTLEEIVDAIILANKVHKGMQDSKEGKFISTDDLLKEMKVWTANSEGIN